MKKLLTLTLCAFFLYSCGEKEAVATDATKTNIPETVVTIAETTAKADGFTIDGVEFAAYPCEGFEPILLHGVFPSAMKNHIVFGLVEDKPKEVFAYYINSVDNEFERIVCSIPEGIEYDRAVPVYAGHGGGSGEVQFAVMLEKGDGKTYVAFDNFTYTDYTNYLTFTCEGVITPETHEYIFEEINKSHS